MTKASHRSTNTAFSLVEVSLALGIAGFCLIAVFGLLPVGLKSNQDATEQTNASALLSAVAADLRATAPTNPPGKPSSSSQFGIAIPASGAAATDPDLFFSYDRQKLDSTNGIPPDKARYRVSVSFLPTPAGGGARSASLALIKVSWPPVFVPAGSPTPSVVNSVQVFTALDRN